MTSSQIFHFLFYATIFCSIFVAIIDAVIYKAFGTIYCRENEPLNGIKVEFWEEDLIGATDDHWDTKYTDINGEFSVSFSEKEIGNEEPYLWITHYCTDEPAFEGCLYNSRLNFVGDFNEDEYQFNVKIILFNNTADVNGNKSYRLEREPDKSNYNEC